MPRPAYNGGYQQARRAVLGLPCWQCGRVATTADHVPPLSSVRPGERWVGVLRPMCKSCMHRQGGRLAAVAGHPSRFEHSRRW